MWPEPSATHALLAKARTGDQAALDDLLARYREPLRRLVALRLDGQVARREDASDIVQDVLLEASRRLQTYLANPVLPFHLWLRQIARDRILDAYRRHRRAQKRSLDRERPLADGSGSAADLGAVLADHELTPASAVARQELAQLVTAAMNDLPDDDREILLMRHAEQLTNQEAAQSLGLSEAAAGMRHLRALRRLRTLLGPKGEP